MKSTLECPLVYKKTRRPLKISEEGLCSLCGVIAGWVSGTWISVLFFSDKAFGLMDLQSFPCCKFVFKSLALWFFSEVYQLEEEVRFLHIFSVCFYFFHRKLTG